MTKSIVPNLTHNKSGTIKDNQELSNEGHSPKVYYYGGNMHDL